MKRKLLGFIMTGAMVFSMLAGCGSKGTDSAKGEVNVFVWTEYVSDSAFSGFEEATGIKVNVSTYSSNEDLLAKLKSESEGTYDVIISYFVYRQTKTYPLKVMESVKSGVAPDVNALSTLILVGTILFVLLTQGDLFKRKARQ